VRDVLKNNIKELVAIGVGEDKYTSLSNALQIIPKGKVLTIHLQQ